MTDTDNNISTTEDYTSSVDLEFIESQLVDLNDNVVILTDKIYGLNSIVLLILTLMAISCIYKLLRFIF